MAVISQTRAALPPGITAYGAALNYDPSFQPLIRWAGFASLGTAALFAAQIGLILTQLALFKAGIAGNWPAFLGLLQAHPWPFLGIKANFMVLRTLTSFSALGYGAVMWRSHKSACLAMAGFAVASMPVAQMAQIIELQLIPLAQQFVAASDGGTRTSLIVQASTLYGVGERTDVFINLVGFNGLLAAWFIAAGTAATPQNWRWWILPIMVLPLGRLLGHSELGLVNALVSCFFMLHVSSLLREVRPLNAS